MYIKSISIDQLRCFSQSTFSFNYPDSDVRISDDTYLSNVSLFLGNNGSGKSTLLKAIALVVLSPVINSSGFVPYYMARRYSDKKRFVNVNTAKVKAQMHFFLNILKKTIKVEHNPSIEISQTGNYEVLKNTDVLSTKEFYEEIKDVFENFSQRFFMIGYGASRRVEEGGSFNPQGLRRSRTVRYQRVAGLFEEHVNLAPFSAWLPRLKERNGQQQAHFDEVIHLLNELLPNSTTISQDSIDEHDVYFVQDGLKLPFEALSDGYRSYLGWVSDLLYHLQSVCRPDQKLVDIPGIVMVDEVDLHLHPEWQRRIVPILARAFPKIQWMLTTHSPIVVGTLHHKNIYVMEQSEDGTTVKQLDERTYGLSAEQILTGSYFGLTTTRAPGAVNRLKELSDKIQQGDKEAVFEMMEQLTRQNLRET